MSEKTPKVSNEELERMLGKIFDEKVKQHMDKLTEQQKVRYRGYNMTDIDRAKLDLEQKRRRDLFDFILHPSKKVEITSGDIESGTFKDFESKDSPAGLLSAIVFIRDRIRETGVIISDEQIDAADRHDYGIKWNYFSKPPKKETFGILSQLKPEEISCILHSTNFCDNQSEYADRIKFMIRNFSIEQITAFGWDANTWICDQFHEQADYNKTSDWNERLAILKKLPVDKIVTIRDGKRSLLYYGNAIVMKALSESSVNTLSKLSTEEWEKIYKTQEELTHERLTAFLGKVASRAELEVEL